MALKSKKKKEKQLKVKEPKPSKIGAREREVEADSESDKPDKKALRAQKKEMKEQTNPGGGVLLGILIFLLVIVGGFDVFILGYIVMRLFSTLPV